MGQSAAQIFENWGVLESNIILFYIRLLK